MENSFTHNIIGKTGLHACRLGLSATYRPGKDTIYKAIDEGINLFFYFHFDSHLTGVLKDVVHTNRDKYILCTGAYNYVYWKTDLRKALEKRLRQLKVDYIDFFMFLGVIREKEMTEDILEQFQRFKDEGKIKFCGISTHHRKLAGRLIDNGSIDILMMRYNAAHRGAEQDIFPFTEKHNPGIISYTATRWRYMMHRPQGWPKDERIPTAGDAYRFVLSNPHVHVCLTAPSNIKQLTENIEAFRKGPLSEDEMAFVRRFGDVIHANARKKGFFNRLMPFSKADLREK